MLLTDEEINDLDCLNLKYDVFDNADIIPETIIPFARAIEAAVMDKMEIVAWGRFDEDDGGRICGALDFENPPLYVTPLYRWKEVK